MTETITNTDKKPIKNKLISTLGIICILSIAGFIYLKMILDKSKELYSVSLPAIALEPETPGIASEAAGLKEKVLPRPVVYKDKKDIKVKILNGTGIPGQAGRVAQIFLKLGFDNIETGNSTKLNLSKTNLILTASVSGVIKEEIINELMKTFSNIEATTSSSSAADIEIITGSQ